MNIRESVVLNPRSVEIVAHRGARTLDDLARIAPENTLPCFQQAAQEGAGIELDVIATQDGHLVVHHDKKTGRVFALPNGDNRVARSTLSDMRQARLNTAGHERGVKGMLGNNAAYAINPAYRSVAIPTLAKVVETLPKTTRFILEGKDGQWEEPMVRLIREKGLQNRATVVSFSWVGVRKVKKLEPGIRTGLNVILPQAVQQSQLVMNLLIKYFKNRLGVDSLNCRYQDVTPRLVRAAHRQGMTVVPWVAGQNRATEQVWFPKLIGLGVDGIITNAPDLLKKALWEAGPQ